ncbi:MAG: nucleotide sugar dehydrogenase [Pseudomonadota bacterium]
MLDQMSSQLETNTVLRFRPRVITEKPTVTVVGLGYVGAVTCGCLSDLGHRVIGVDVDPAKRAHIANGRAPIHETELDTLLACGVEEGRISAEPSLLAAVVSSDVTFVSVGTPTAPDGGCDLRYIEAVADEIGDALATIAGFHVVVLRCSVPPGTTVGVMARRIEERSGRVMGVDFGVAFVPEFLREGVAVADFRKPPKTVIGASDERSAAIVSTIFAPIDAAPIQVSIETAELVKYVDNVWHAAKVTFANEVGRLSKAVGVDGRRVMEVFCEDTKLNLSPYYLKPGNAYGGSCLPKEVRAVAHLAAQHRVTLPMMQSLEASNAVQVAEAVRLVRETGARRVGVLGVAFKPGTDDIRESPVLEVMAELMADGTALAAHDACISGDTDLGTQIRYVANGALGAARVAPHLGAMLRGRISEVLDQADAVIVTHDLPEYRMALRCCSVPVIDLARILRRPRADRGDQGIGW